MPLRQLLTFLFITLLSVGSNAVRLMATPPFPDNPNIKHLLFNHVVDLIHHYEQQGYSVMDSVYGNLNNDKHTDLLLLLRDQNEHKEKEGDTSEIHDRLLLIVIQTRDNKWQVARTNEQTVYCNICGGMMGDPYVRMSINKGSFTIYHYGGSAWRWTKQVTFKYNSQQEEWMLQKIKLEGFHALRYKKKTRQIKTARKFGAVKMEDYNIYKDE